MAKSKLQIHEDDIQYVYPGKGTIFMVRNNRIIGMILLYAEEPLAPNQHIEMGSVKL